MCINGYTGKHCEVNEDDCKASRGGCEHGACIDETARTRCECDPGYVGKKQRYMLTLSKNTF